MMKQCALSRTYVQRPLRLLLPPLLAVSSIISCGEEVQAKSQKQPNSALSQVTPAKSQGPAKSLSKSYEEALKALREAGFAKAAEILEKRVNQEKPKMKLSKDQARDAALYLVQDLPEMPKAKTLYYFMPHSTIELIRGVNERDVPRKEAEKIAAYLLTFISSMKFQNLKQLDSNHSHVIGREWHQIDYSGEGMTWQGQKRKWSKKGVKNFTKPEWIHNYFKHASKYPYFKRIYKPQGHLPQAP